MFENMVQKFKTANIATKIALGFAGGLVVILLACLFGFLFGWIIQLLWNALLVDLFDFPEISFWQAVGIFILAKLIFGFGGGGGQQQEKKSKKKAKSSAVEMCEETVEIENEPTTTEEDQTELPDELHFKEFWQTEGKKAYLTYQDARKKGGNVGLDNEDGK